MLEDRLRRVTDLFVEGSECYLGMDRDNKPVMIWVNKLNSFEIEETRRDGMVRRGERILQLSKEDSPEYQSIKATLDRWSDEDLRQRRVDQRSEEIYLNTINDLEGDEVWAEKLSMMRRLPTLLDDQKATVDDPRRDQLEKLNNEYLEALRQGQEKRQREFLTEIEQLDRETLEEDYFEAWRNRVSLDEYMEEKRVTELFYAMRDCVATEKGRDSTTGRLLWDHSDCNHASRLLQQRKQVRELPETVIEKVIDILDDVTVPFRESGNSDAPASSSASSERPNEEADSTASTPEETSPAVPTISVPQ